MSDDGVGSAFVWQPHAVYYRLEKKQLVVFAVLHQLDWCQEGHLKGR